MTTHDELHPGDSDDLIWLADRQPRGPELGRDAQRAARASLLAFIDSTGDGAAPPPRDATPPIITAPASTTTFTVGGGGRSRGPWLRRTAAAVALAAVAVTVVLGALPAGRGGVGNGLAPAAAEAAPLVKLSRTISTTPAPSGDATLTYSDSINTGEHPSRFTKYNLVLDGRFRQFFGATLSGLRTAKSGTDTITGEVKDYGPGTISGWIQAAADSAGKSPQEAAAAIEGASGIPIIASSKDAATLARLRKSQFDNHVWITALSVIELAGGRPDVRSGALAAMASVGAKTAYATEAGRPVLRVTLHTPASKPGENAGDETLTIDAHTGVPIRYTAGPSGQTPPTEVTYEVSRVNAADYGH